ncbi:related to amidase [Cephalotrichum gorgonifer]|uniref:Related to amidase n=1 Tax=Cephalotrichum gorgonifer TaxID=2041049 RepID=A0AAE8MX29_9PEZI|nr:related to amidase [Cephalotrichum gorgonifer]
MTKIGLMMLIYKLAFAVALCAATDVGQRVILPPVARADSTTAIRDERFPPLLDATLEDLASGLESGLFTSVDLVNAYIARILEVNDTLKAVTELNPDALSIAAEADDSRARGEVAGPLHGIPILLKNNIATDDGMSNTAGSYALLGAKVPRDSTVAAKLRKAGAVILGKTNLSQWANYRSSYSSSSNGWSAYGGQTEGAYYPQQDPSGSSSGSGVASSLGLAFASLGTETDGSITGPSESNNLVGIKPTVGLTSRYLVVPISERQDTVGPMARTVKDAAYVLAAISGPDPRDNYTSSIPFYSLPDYVKACDLSALQGKRVGVPRNMINPAEYVEPMVAAFNESLDIFRAAGAEVVDDIRLEGWDLLVSNATLNNILPADFVINIAQYFDQLTVNPHNIASLPDLQSFTQGFELEAWPDRDTATWERALELGVDNTSPEFWPIYSTAYYYAGELGITGALRNMSLDAIIVPSMSASHLPAIIGAPIVTVPLGKMPENTTVIRNGRGDLNTIAPNIPFGISFLGEHYSEERLIGMAYAFEQLTMARKKVAPYIQPTTELGSVVETR